MDNQNSYNNLGLTNTISLVSTNDSTQDSSIKSQINPLTPDIQKEGNNFSNNEFLTNPPPIKKSSRNKKIVATFLGILLLMGGLGAGIFLTQKSQNFREKAASESSSLELKPSNTKEENTPENQKNTDTTNSPLDINPIAFTCSKIEIYTVTGDLEIPSNWKKLSDNEISNLKSGDIIYFVVNGSETSGYGVVEKAIITVNGKEYEGKRKNTGIMCPAVEGASCPFAFYTEYTIPKDVYKFTVNAKLYHAYYDSGKWF